MTERKRGCGYRKCGKMYLVGTGLAIPCDNLPYLLEPCDCCGYTPKFSRAFQWINKRYIKQHPSPMYSILESEVIKCDCPITCPICHPYSNDLKQYGLMYVGSMYTPDSFIKEAKEMGISKAIPKIPKGLEFGKTWVLLAHMKVPFYNGEVLSEEPELKPAIFYAFKPQRVEMLLFEKDATEEKLKELREQEITPIIVKDGDEKHK